MCTKVRLLFCFCFFLGIQLRSNANGPHLIFDIPHTTFQPIPPSTKNPNTYFYSKPDSEQPQQYLSMHILTSRYEGQTTVGLGFIEVGHSGVDTTSSEYVRKILVAHSV